MSSNDVEIEIRSALECSHQWRIIPDTLYAVGIGLTQESYAIKCMKCWKFMDKDKAIELLNKTKY